MSDADLRDLERRARATGDPGLTREHARALARSGDPAAALRALAPLAGVSPIKDDVAAVVAGIEPLSDDALRALDVVTRGGVDPDAPWPCAGGDGWRTGRSRARGPTRGEVVLRRPLPLDPRLRVTEFCVDGRGKVLAATEPPGLPPLVWVGQDGKLERTGLEGLFPMLLATGPAGVSPRSSVVHDAGAGVRQVRVAGPVCIAAGHFIDSSEDVVRATSIATGVERWSCDARRHAGDLAGIGLARGAVLVSTDGYPLPPTGAQWEEGTVLRLDLCTGALVHGDTPDAHPRLSGLDGVAFLADNLRTFAVATDGRALWHAQGEPLAIAGGEERPLVLVDVPRGPSPGVIDGGPRRRRILRALDARTGSARWEVDDDHDGVAVDVRGVPYARRERRLVALDPATGERALSVDINARRWGFAFAPGGRAIVLREHAGQVELWVIE